MGPGGPSCPGAPGSPCSPCEKTFDISECYSRCVSSCPLLIFCAHSMINRPNRGKKCAGINKQTKVWAKWKYRLFHEVYHHAWAGLFFKCVRVYVCVFDQMYIQYWRNHCVAKTYNRAGDSSQTLRSWFSWRSLRSDWSGFTCWTLRAGFTLSEEVQMTQVTSEIC